MLVSCPSRSQVRNFPASVISCFAVRVALSMLRTGFAVSRSLRRWCQRANCSIGVWISGVRSSVVRRWSSQVSKRARRGSPRLGIMWWWTSISRRCSTLRDGGSASNALCDNCNSRITDHGEQRGGRGVAHPGDDAFRARDRGEFGDEAFDPQVGGRVRFQDGLEVECEHAAGALPAAQALGFATATVAHEVGGDTGAVAADVGPGGGTARQQPLLTAERARPVGTGCRSEACPADRPVGPVRADPRDQGFRTDRIPRCRRCGDDRAGVVQSSRSTIRARTGR